MQTNKRQAHLRDAAENFSDLTLIWQEFMRRPLQTATIAPSSKHLAMRMAESLALAEARTVVELGPGTGSVTRVVLPYLRPDAKFVAIERNPVLAESWRKRFPRHTVLEGSVENLRELCSSVGIHEVDCIVSGLPWASFPDWLQVKALDEIHGILRPGGQMSTFGYHVGLMMASGKRFHRMLPPRFDRVEHLPWEWRNLPPAFVLRVSR